MMMMHRVALFVAAAALAAAQDTPDLFKKAPPGVEDALRQRITEFYQYHVEGKFRQAEKLVAEDTKDFYFTAGKPRYISFEINKIEYSEDFTKAKVILLCEQQVVMPMAGAQIFKVPTPSRWKLEDGKWCWYVDLKDLQKTPWGNSPVNPMANPDQKAKAIPKMPDAAEVQGLLTGVRADKGKVELKEVGSEAEVKITNGVPGAVNLVMEGNSLGLEASVEKAQLKKDDVAVVRIRRGAASKAGTLTVRVEPTNQVIPIQVALAELAPVVEEPKAPAEVKADKAKVQLKKVGAEVEIRISSTVAEPVSLVVAAPFGLRARVGKANLAKGESTVLRLMRLKGSKAGTVTVKVQPTNQSIPIQVSF
jgi:hypothetical protein